jgi:hypothetical protein
MPFLATKLLLVNSGVPLEQLYVSSRLAAGMARRDETFSHYQTCRLGQTRFGGECLAEASQSAPLSEREIPSHGFTRIERFTGSSDPLLPLRYRRYRGLPLHQRQCDRGTGPRAR